MIVIMWGIVIIIMIMIILMIVIIIMIMMILMIVIIIMIMMILIIVIIIMMSRRRVNISTSTPAWLQHHDTLDDCEHNHDHGHDEKGEHLHTHTHTHPPCIRYHMHIILAMVANIICLSACFALN